MDSEGSHTTSPGKYSAWINIDIPIPDPRPHRVTTMVTADSTISEEHAGKKAAYKAVRMIVKNGNIVITHLTRMACKDNRVLQEKKTAPYPPSICMYIF
jgi:hypothetical protein